MTVCRFPGNGDMYGLGIRLGYYFQWFGAVFAAWMAPSEVKSLRFANDIFIAATFLALIILTAGNVDSLQPVEIYIILLLMFSAYLALIPIYVWRLLTRCDPYWDPTRWPIVDSGPLSANLNFILLIGVLVYQYWFWFAKVPSLDKATCQQYGFLFGQVRLNSKASVVINVLIYVFLGLICLYLLALKLRKMLGFPDRRRTKRVISRRRKYAHIQLLRNMEGWGKLIVAATVIAAAELTIQWNEIQDVNTLSSAGQTIPFLIGLAAFVRILYVYLLLEDEEYSDSDDDYSYTRSHRTYPRHGGGGGSQRHPVRPIPEDQLPRVAAIPIRQPTRVRPAPVFRGDFR